MNRLSLALAISLAGAGIAAAQSGNQTGVSPGLAMLHNLLSSKIAPYDIDLNVDELTVAQVTEVIARIDDGADTKQEIEEAIELALSR
jgi:hypothetical protein